MSGIPDRRGPTNLIVANLAYLHAKLALEPYEIWLDTRDGVSSAAVYADMQDEGLVVERLYDTSQVLLGVRNDAMVQSTNGALTLGFAIAMLTSIAGFIVFWVMALRTRTLQFGVLPGDGAASPSGDGDADHRAAGAGGGRRADRLRRRPAGG